MSKIMPCAIIIDDHDINSSKQARCEAPLLQKRAGLACETFQTDVASQGDSQQRLTVAMAQRAQNRWPHSKATGWYMMSRQTAHFKASMESRLLVEVASPLLEVASLDSLCASALDLSSSCNSIETACDKTGGQALRHLSFHEACLKKASVHF